MIEHRFQIIQGDMIVAEGSDPDELSVLREALHYAQQYAKDGPVLLRMIPPKQAKRTSKRDDDDLAAWQKRVKDTLIRLGYMK